MNLRKKLAVALKFRKEIQMANQESDTDNFFLLDTKELLKNFAWWDKEKWREIQSYNSIWMNWKLQLLEVKEYTIALFDQG